MKISILSDFKDYQPRSNSAFTQMGFRFALHGDIPENKKQLIAFSLVSTMQTAFLSGENSKMITGYNLAEKSERDRFISDTVTILMEGIYLGCGVNQIKNKYAAIIIPAFFFALQHSFIPTLFDVRYIIYRFLSFLPLTIILCCHYQKHRNPLPIMIGHAVIDVATVAQILATSAVPGLYEMMCAM